MTYAGTNAINGISSTLVRDGQISGHSFGLDSHNEAFQRQTLVTSTLPLPDPNQFVTTSWNLAWTQILAYAAACIGLLLCAYVFRAFMGK
jgi:hypothetical protein